MRNNNLAVIFNEVQTGRLTLRRLRVEDGPAMFAVHVVFVSDWMPVNDD
jgi:hypothetical protein